MLFIKHYIQLNRLIICQLLSVSIEKQLRVYIIQQSTLPTKTMSSSKFQKFIVFNLTFFAYAGLHCLRQGWSYSKKQLQNQFAITAPQFGLIDTLYLFAYSIGMATIGNLSSRIGLKYFVGVGMILSAFYYMSFSFSYLFTHTYSYLVLVIGMCFNGFFQSTGWPGVMGIVGNWFGKGKRGLLMGFWGINANIGNIIALVVCNILDQSNHLPWTYNFIVTGCFTIAVGICCIMFLKQKPMQKQNTLIQSQKHDEQPHSSDSIILTQQINSVQSEQMVQKQINVFTALFLPRVPFYVIGYACTKGCIYGLLFWLPTYLDNKGLAQEKGYIAAMVDLGSFIGGMGVGYLGDIYSYRALFLTPFLAMSAGIMFIVSFALTDSAWTYYVALLFIGLFMGGPYNIIGTAITIDLGEQAGKKNIAKVSALIEGSAAVFAALSQIVISIMPFSSIFYLFCGECMLAALALLPLFLKDLREVRAKNKEQIV